MINKIFQSSSQKKHSDSLCELPQNEEKAFIHHTTGILPFSIERIHFRNISKRGILICLGTLPDPFLPLFFSLPPSFPNLSFPLFPITLSLSVFLFISFSLCHFLPHSLDLPSNVMIDQVCHAATLSCHQFMNSSFLLIFSSLLFTFFSSLSLPLLHFHFTSISLFLPSLLNILGNAQSCKGKKILEAPRYLIFQGKFDFLMIYENDLIFRILLLVLLIDYVLGTRSTDLELC